MSHHYSRIRVRAADYVEDVPLQEGEELPAAIFITVGWFDEDSRELIMGQIRSRVGECTRADSVSDAENFEFTPPARFVGVDEGVAFFAEFPSPSLNLPPYVTLCQMVRVDAVVLRACPLITQIGDSSADRFTTEERLQYRARELLQPMVQRARQEQT